MIVYGMIENCSERDVAYVSLMPSPKILCESYLKGFGQFP